MTIKAGRKSRLHRLEAEAERCLRKFRLAESSYNAAVRAVEDEIRRRQAACKHPPSDMVKEEHEMSTVYGCSACGKRLTDVEWYGTRGVPVKVPV